MEVLDSDYPTCSCLQQLPLNTAGFSYQTQCSREGNRQPQKLTSISFCCWQTILVSILLSNEVKSTSKYLRVLKGELISLLFVKVVRYFPLKELILLILQLILLLDNFTRKKKSK